MEEQQRKRIEEDLRGVIRGELLFDDVFRELYSTDASLFQVRPAGVVVPRDEEDLCHLVRYAAEHKVPLIPRGAGTGLAGESLGRGVVVDLSTHFRSILAVGEETVQVQPGVTCRAVNDRLAPLGRRFAPDTASADQCTIGGMLATNASGARLLRYGYTTDHVDRLRVVLDNGDAADVGLELVPVAADERGEHLHDILSATAMLLAQNADVISTGRPRTRYDRCGYALHGVLRDEHLDLPRLLVGSEGTLAFFTESTLRTVPIPPARALVLLAFASLDDALRAVERILPTGPSACELIDRRLLTVARQTGTCRAAALIPSGVEAVVLVEYEGDSPQDVRWAARRTPVLLTRPYRLDVQHIVATEPGEIDLLWQLREAALPSLYSGLGGARPVPVMEDVGVPREELGRYLHLVQDILQEHETSASFLVHAGTGQVHARPLVDLANPDEVSRLAVITEKVHQLALDLGGTVSTQHGTGIGRTEWVARQYPTLYPVFRQLKAVFDPQGIFNPGKIVDPRPSLSSWPLRTIPAAPPAPLLLWGAGGPAGEALRCNGCGLCRGAAPARRMCPVFHATHAEAATPRAKANLLRQLLTRAGNGVSPSPDEVREVADLCVNCKMCARECPAGVNIPKLMLEAKAAHVVERGLYRRDWFFARVEGFARWGNAFALPVNLALASRSARWVLEKLFGLSRRRRLPLFSPRSFLQLARRRGLSRKPRGARPKVAYFVDVYANLIDPAIGEATLAVLRHNGFDVYVPPAQRGSGLASLAHGDLDTARDIARRNLRVLAPAVRDGCTVVCSEPGAALMLRQDYADLLDDPEAALVAANTEELTSFLWQLYQQGRLRTDFRPLPLRLGHHVPCHIKALEGTPAGPRLLSLIPRLEVRTIDVSCSGMAGTFGLRAENHETSLAAGRAMIQELDRPGVIFGSTECCSCRMQMEDGGGKRTLHPVQYLALAYGLLPDLADRLREPIGELVLP